MGRRVERKRSDIEVSKITVIVSKSKGVRPCETECKGNLTTGYTTHGIKSVGTFKRVKANGGSAGVDQITIAQVEENKRKYLYPLWNSMANSWVIDLDIKGFFDNIDHELLMKAMRYHTDRKHILLYCERWLEAPVQLPDGTAEVVQGCKSSPHEMGSQQVSEIQASPLVHCLQIPERNLKGLPEFV